MQTRSGYCNASNAYFAELYDKHKDTISDWINNLKEAGYVETEVIKDDLGRVEERRIYLSAKTPRGYRQKCLGGIGENALGNITSINNKEEEERKNFFQQDLKEVINFYEKNITLITPYVAEDMEKYLQEGLTAGLIIKAMQEAVDRNARSWKYIKSILNDCYNNKVKTAEQFKIRQEEFKSNKNHNQSKVKTEEKEDYEEVEYTEEEYRKKLYEKQKGGNDV